MIFRRETIMVAAHDEVMRRAVSHLLGRDGYKIIQARSAEDAVRTAARHENVIDVLVTEISLPASRGNNLAELLKLDYPDLQVVYMSGLKEAASVVRDRRLTIVVLQNPLRADRLRRAIRQALQKRRHKSGLKTGAVSLMAAVQSWWHKARPSLTA